MDVNKDVSSDFLSFSAFLNLQGIKDHEAKISKQLIFFNALTDVRITSRKKTQLKLQNLAKMTQYESILTFLKLIRKNYLLQSFELPII